MLYLWRLSNLQMSSAPVMTSKFLLRVGTAAAVPTKVCRQQQQQPRLPVLRSLASKNVQYQVYKIAQLEPYPHPLACLLIYLSSKTRAGGAGCGHTYLWPHARNIPRSYRAVGNQRLSKDAAVSGLHISRYIFHDAAGGSLL